MILRNGLSKGIYLKIFLWLIMTSYINLSHCQPQKFQKYSTLSIGFGSSNYYGDVAPKNYFINSSLNSLRWSGNIGFSHHIRPKIIAFSSISFIRIGADDYNSDDLKLYMRNLHFRNDIKEFSIGFAYYFTSNGQNFKRRKLITPYAFLGLSYFRHNPVARIEENFKTKWVQLQPLRTEGQGTPNNPEYSKPYNLNQLSIPLGIGFSYRINQNIDLGIEINYRNLFTDFIDDVKGIYANPLFLENDIAKKLSNRALEPLDYRTGQDRQSKLIKLLQREGYPINDIPSTLNDNNQIGTNRGTIYGNDFFFTVSLNFQYHIPQKIKCPVLL